MDHGQRNRASRLTFLDLPSEVRNQIYGYCILAPELEIGSKAQTAARSYGDPTLLERPEANPEGTSFAEYWQEMPIERSPATRQTSWTVEPIEIYRKFVINQTSNVALGETIARRVHIPGGFRAFKASYVKSDRTPSLSVNLFLANKQICREASTLFYEKNHFVFNNRWEDVHFAPMAFLWDHPGAYISMRSLHIVMPDPPNFTNNGRMPRGEDAVPSNGMWKDLITQICKMKLQHFGVTVSVDITDRFNFVPPNFPFSAAYTYRWYEALFAINGLQSMRLLFDVNPEYTNPDMSSVTQNKGSDIPAVMTLAQKTKYHWLSGKGSYEHSLLFMSLSKGGEGATGQRLEFVSWMKADNPGLWVFPLHQLPPFLWQQDPAWYQHRDLTKQYRMQHYTRSGIQRLLGLSDNEAERLILRR
ncbi:uncharacterized protein N0V89_007985 [Didymosphaeria variabile]|uniref:F-box domain-containing protein n=1 Tax=Didymosphaeria variabile TaxID=1932322 RepID=A0A9W9C831_9PLEO|nr:uncharacterized protein N0V89_007985 [Didymosphaeria variabile]KAJ4349371.1 hypothetical protein N0V89_007985 [Didymosphaeria variabile]